MWSGEIMDKKKMYVDDENDLMLEIIKIQEEIKCKIGHSLF